MISAPSSPVQNRRLLSARNARMSSIEMPDDNEKSVSSASTSPCHSPVSWKKPPHNIRKSNCVLLCLQKSRLLAPNLFVVLYNFKPRHADELELKWVYWGFSCVIDCAYHGPICSSGLVTSWLWLIAVTRTGGRANVLALSAFSLPPM